TDVSSPLSTNRWTAARGTPAARAISSTVKTSSWDSIDAQVQEANPLPPVGSVIRPELRNKSESDTRVSLQQVIGGLTQTPPAFIPSTKLYPSRSPSVRTARSPAVSSAVTLAAATSGLVRD